MRRRGGFTLLEVLLAVFVLAAFVGTLLMLLTDNLRALGRARARAEIMTVAGEHMESILETGGALEDGISDGSFEEPNEDLLWELEVVPYPLPLANATPEAIQSSSLFAEPTTNPADPQPSVRRVVLRVFREGADPDEAVPFVVFVVAPGAASSPSGAAGGAELGS